LEIPFEPRQPRILTFDIETTPIIAYSWGPKWEANLIEIIEPSKVLSFSAKWLNGKHITKGWIDYRSDNDRQIVEDIWDLFNEADIIVVQNGRVFDTKTLNSRFLNYSMTPPAPYKIVDTLLEARKYLRLPSYSLDDMCDYFGIGRKVEHEGFPLWKRCMTGDKKAWKKMLKYNKHDVTLTEKLYLKLRPFMASHPNLGMYTNQLVCPKCGSRKIQSRGWRINKTTRYKKVFCSNCGGWGSFSKNLQEFKPIVSF
jgi:DNA polymerase elongation subunit (family B)